MYNMCVCVYIYIYIEIYTERERERESETEREAADEPRGLRGRGRALGAKGSELRAQT